MNFRKAVYGAAGWIDLEIEHARLGWIPFTARSDDPEPFGRAVFAAASTGDVAPYVAPSPVAIDYDALDNETLNAALTQQGSAFRALAEVFFEEINIVRTKANLAARTKPQFVAALKSKMR